VLIQRTRGAVLALAAVAAFASGAAAETAGKGSVGGSIGVPFFLSDEDTKNGQSPRVLGQLHFQYVFTPKTRIALAGGYGWVGYKDGTLAPYKMVDPATGDSVQVMDDVLTKIQPFSLTLLRSFRAQGSGWVPYAGAGINLTRIEIVNDRRKIKDPATFDSYVNWAPGVQAQGGFEYFLGSNDNVSFDLHARFAKLFSKDEEQFPTGFTGPHTYAAINFGVNVYFWPIGHKPVETAKEPAADPSTLAPAPLPGDTPAEPAPTPPDTTQAPVPAPTPPDTTVTPDTTETPDTTRAPGSQAPVRSAAKAAAAKPAPSAAVVPAAPAPGHEPAATEPVICPAPRPSEGTSGMFGVPGVPVTPPRRDDSPVFPDSLPPGPVPDAADPEGGSAP
jgi:hypothetical protein